MYCSSRLSILDTTGQGDILTALFAVADNGDNNDFKIVCLASGDLHSSLAKIKAGVSIRFTFSGPTC